MTSGPGHESVHHPSWDERYAERMWSGNVNQAIAAEAEGLTPGRVLDVGCGEGADAVWFAQRGWDVTALDPSSVAVARGREAADAAGVSVTWVVAPLEDAGLDREAFDLVSAAYPALLKESDALQAMVGAVAPGGRLLWVHHAEVDRERARAHGCDPDDYVNADDLRSHLPAGWIVETDGVRDRSVTGGAGAHHTLDRVLVVRRPA